MTEKTTGVSPRRSQFCCYNSPPRLLDLYCGEGGAGMGYHRAGFEVVGVDINPQPRYPFMFIQGDALDYARAHGHEYDVIHASPPCQAYSVTRHALAPQYRPELIPQTRELLEYLGKPWVIENVVGAPLRWYVELCGVMFGLKTYRHRRFEMSFLVFQPEHLPHPERLTRKGRAASPGGFSNPCGHPNFAGEADIWKRSLGINWMTTRGLTQAIPPAYTEWIGNQLMPLLAVGAGNYNDKHEGRGE